MNNKNWRVFAATNPSDAMSVKRDGDIIVSKSNGIFQVDVNGQSIEFNDINDTAEAYAARNAIRNSDEWVKQIEADAIEYDANLVTDYDYLPIGTNLKRNGVWMTIVSFRGQKVAAPIRNRADIERLENQAIDADLDEMRSDWGKGQGWL